MAVLLGTLWSIALPGSAQGQEVEPEPRNAVLDFQGADLGAVLTALARAGGFNLVLAELPPRTVTLQVQ
ncbi:MAG: hypothetical protein ACREKM_00580, partial [Longimicrobiales bacterium]